MLTAKATNSRFYRDASNLMKNNNAFQLVANGASRSCEVKLLQPLLLKNKV